MPMGWSDGSQALLLLARSVCRGGVARRVPHDAAAWLALCTAPRIPHAVRHVTAHAVRHMVRHIRGTAREQSCAGVGGNKCDGARMRYGT
eukprot:227216-Chlamydomonas_euryale.AAC.2